jgi:signal transduction histidine kinase
MSYSLTEITLFISIPLLLGLIAAAWRFRDNPGAKLFGILQSLSVVWVALAIVGLQLSPGAPRLRVWGLNSGMSLVVVVFWFAFILSYTGRDDLITPEQFGVASVPLAIGAGLYFIAPSWSPLVGQVDQTPSYIGTLVQPSIGPVGNVLGLYIYAVFLAGLGLVVKSIFEGNSLFVGQGLALAIGSLVTVIASFFGVIGVPFEGYPATEVALAGQSLFWGYAVFAQQFLQAVPAVAAIGERAVFDDLDDAVVVVDESGTVIRANPAARSYLDLDEIVNDTVEPLLDRMGVSSVTELPARFQTRGHTYRAKASPITDWRGESIGRSIIIQDITSLNRRQQRLQVLNRILRHNVRNDMNLVLGMSSQLQERGDERLTTIGETISQRVGNLIDISEKAVEIDNVFDETAAKQIDLETFVEELTSPLADQYPTATVRADVSADTVHTDPGVLSLVVEELLTNALEHTGDAPAVTVDVSRPSDRVRISVTDDGPGIPRMEIDPILTGEETDLEHASSLGLWLVYWGAQSLNGELDITATADGTTATVTIPNMESTETPPS